MSLRFSFPWYFGVIVAVLVVATVFPLFAQAPARKSHNNDSADLIAQGVDSLERNDLSAAKSQFLEALQLNPRDATAHIYLGIIADRAGDLKGAEVHFANAVRVDPRSPSAHNNHGASLVKLGRSKEAAIEFVNSLNLDRNQPNALVNLARLRLDSGTEPNLREALELFDQGYKLRPDVDIARALVVVALRLKKRDAAATYYREYSLRVAQEQTQNTAPTARAELGAALLENALSSEAILELTAAVNGDPANTETIIRLSKAHLAANDIPAAGRVLESAVAQGIESAPLYAQLASVYEKGGHIENAIPAWRLAIQRDPQSDIYRFTYGMLLITALAPDAAVIRLREALELFPRSSKLWLALGIANFKGGRNDEAAKSLTKSIELEPKYAPAHVYLGMTYVEVGQYPTALDAYGHALVLNPKLWIVNFLSADVMLKQTNADNTAIENHLLKAVRADPNFAPGRLALGKLYLRTRRLAEAATEFETVIKIEPKVAEAYYQLALAYSRLRRTEESQKLMDQFKQLSETQKEQALKDRKDIINRLANVLF